MASTIPAFYAQETIRMIRQPRPALEALLAELALPVALLDDERVPGDMEAETYGRLFIALLRLMQQDLYKNPEPVLDLSSYRLMYGYMLQADNLHNAIERAATYYLRFHPQQQGFKLEVQGNLAVWRFDMAGDDEDQAAGAAIEHFRMGDLSWLPGLTGRMIALYTWHRLASWLVGNYIDLSAVRLKYALQGQAEDFIKPFRAPFYFNQSQCSLEFHSRYLKHPIVRKEADLQRMLETFPAELMRTDELADSSAAQVRGLLGHDYRMEMPSLEQVAQRLHTTTATLHRRLRAEGTSYQQIKDGCRRDAAIALLRGGHHAGGAIAEQLGFSDASTFFRAFKKWTGLTPQQFLRKES